MFAHHTHTHTLTLTLTLTLTHNDSCTIFTSETGDDYVIQVIVISAMFDFELLSAQVTWMG